jgi:hypothetical protein
MDDGATSFKVGLQNRTDIFAAKKFVVGVMLNGW